MNGENRSGDERGFSNGVALYLNRKQQVECRAAGSTYAAIWLVSDAD